MLNVEIKVNGQLIGFLNIHNEHKVYWDATDPDLYSYSVKGFIDNGVISSCAVQHHRKDGALTLIKKTIEKLEKQK